MKKVNSVKVGDVVQFPWLHSEPWRTGLNGWLFRAGIIEKVWTGAKTGAKYARVRYCVSTAGRYTLLPNVEETKDVRLDNLFSYNVEYNRKMYLEFLNAEKNGEQICWSADTALLVNHNIF